MSKQRRYEVTDTQWEQLRKYFPQRKAGDRGRPRNEDRPILNGILWIMRTGAPWEDLPERYGAKSTVYDRFVLWQKSGLFAKILEELGEEADLENIGMDSTSVDAHQHSAGAKKGAENAETQQHIGVSRGGKTTKIFAIVDALGNPIHVHLVAGNVHDSKEAEPSLTSVQLGEGTTVLADKAFGSKAIRAFITSSGAEYCIPPKANEIPWYYDKHLYKERHLVECFFQKLKQYRGIATRFCKLAFRFLAFVQLASVMIWLA